MVNAARRSRYRAMVTDMVPRPGSGRSTGPAYSSRMFEFVQNHWDPGNACAGADSLERCIFALRGLSKPA